VLLRVLGSAAGGGSPQWNCGCPVCAAVRSRAGLARTQSSVAVSADNNKQWFLINASPDVRIQIEAFPGLHPHEDRTTPLEAVLLTDAELDHTLGLLLLREARAGLLLYATPAVHKTLCDGSGVLRTLERYCPGVQSLTPPGGGSSVETRGMSSVETLRGEIAGCDCLLIDGTCWRDDELVRLGLAGKTSREMGHLPIQGPDGSLAQLPSLGVGRTIFVHMNNTNPILLEDAPERRIVEDSGMEVAMDGLEVEV
jgi:pyrroloquinoline quinone biosynthesis protein B